MEVRNRPNEPAQQGATRLYTHGSTAYAYQPATAPKPVETPRQEPQVKPEPQKKARPQQRRALSAGCKVCLFISIAVVCAAFSMLMYRYYNISNEYLSVNKLNDNIKTIKLEIQTLHVELDSVVTIQEVQVAAQNWGMTYPGAEQYVSAGDPLPRVNRAADENTQDIPADEGNDTGGDDTGDVAPGDGGTGGN
ncbi:hypothetical protein LJC27_04295 [Christensenellaceae bacterium OttesenSCG-928-M15]|nr:hypothetical protein [Christensenellaceae bacterium OttesenSCG-928-M15]